ncbi:MAG: PAN domain-containing protein [Candidatus Thiodiazotropha sp.]
MFTGSYLDGYNKYPGQVTQTQGFTTLAGISTANYCAQKCSNAQNNTCKSFDFCSGSSLCTLKHSHVLELPTTAVTSSNVCSHYSSKYIQFKAKLDMYKYQRNIAIPILLNPGEDKNFIQSQQ